MNNKRRWVEEGFFLGGGSKRLLEKLLGQQHTITPAAFKHERQCLYVNRLIQAFLKVNYAA